MLSNRLIFAALAVACIGAAAGGGYLATRQNAVPAPALAQEQPAPVAAPAMIAPTASAAAGTASSSAGLQAGASDAPVKAAQETAAVVPAPAAPKTIAPRPAEPAARVTPMRDRPAAPRVVRQEQIPAPPSAAPQSPAPTTAAIDSVPAAQKPEERAMPEPARAPEPPAHMFEELVVSADSVLGLQTENRLSSETARVEDHIDARVTRDVRVGGKVAIPAGSRALGSVVVVERGGKVKERAKLGVRFHTLVLADGTRIPIATDTIYRDGEAPGNASSSKIGGAAVGGAILGAILGGSKGMAIGAAAGAGAGGAAVAAGDRNAATLAAGSPLTVRILQPVTITTDKD